MNPVSEAVFNAMPKVNGAEKFYREVDDTVVEVGYRTPDNREATVKFCMYDCVFMGAQHFTTRFHEELSAALKKEGILT